MAISQRLQELYGLPAFDFPEAGRELKRKLPDPDAVAWRVEVDSYDSDEAWEGAFARFLDMVDTTEVRALIVGAWSDAYDSGPDAIIAALLAARDRLPGLRALFLGDITSEQCEISWIHQGAVTPLLEGFPQLHEFAVRGGTDLVFDPLRHEQLRSLTVETGGLPVAVVRGIGASDLPALEHLDIWLGTSWYGADSEVSDLAPILSGARLPSLKRLALCNSDIQDEIAVAVAAAPVVARLERLDLSMGTIGDVGAAALLSGQPLTHLTSLDLNHNYLSDAMRERLRQALEPAGVELDLDGSDADEDEDEDGVQRYTAVGE
ncbi:STM4015 family protein [Streptomyces sp. NPDC058001]|uniref:STM4015 family protein n=1 Tax=Streptomyces sp. NPDC058001 TaxID=3346300 RepID=UPI0036E3390D